VGLETPPASRFISFSTADHDPVRRGYESLGVICGITTAHTYGERLRDELGHGEKLGHGLERLAQVILIQTGHDDPFAHVGELVANINEMRIEELTFVDSNDFGSVVDFFQYLLRGAYDLGLDAHVAVGDDMIVAVATVDLRLEDLYTLAGDLSSTKAADHFFALAAEHASGNDFDPTGTRTNNFHCHLPLELFHAFHVFPLEGVDAYLFVRLNEVRDLDD
jgi:hypothetical protein